MAQRLRIEHHRQEEVAGCLAACTQMTLQFIGILKSQQEINRQLGLTSVGVPSSHIQRLSGPSISIFYGAGDEQTLRASIDRGSPPIVFLATGDLPYWKVNLRHAVVVAGYDQDEILLYDPAFADYPKHVKWGDFLLAWSEFDYYYALITSPARQP